MTYRLSKYKIRYTKVKDYQSFIYGEIKNDFKFGRWSGEEHLRFLEGFRAFGKNWKDISNYVGRRSEIQVRTHAQKYFTRGQCTDMGAYLDSYNGVTNWLDTMDEILGISDFKEISNVLHDRNNMVYWEKKM